MYRIFLYFTVVILLLACKRPSIVYPQRHTIIQTVYASGKVMADSEYTVSALNAGTIVGKLVHEGEQVSRGQVLYTLRHTAQAAKLEAANSAYTIAMENMSANSRVLNDLRIAVQNADLKFSNDSLLYIRYKNLWAQNIGTKVTLDNARMQYDISYNLKRSAREKYRATINDLRVAMKNARSQAAGSQSDLDNYFIRAENSGTVYQLLKEPGEVVKVNEPVALLGRTAGRIIRLAVDQQDIAQIRIGQTLLLKTDASGDHIYKANITRIYPVMNEADQTFRVDAVFSDRTSPPFIHSSVEANIIIAKKVNCLTIPLSCLLNGDSILVRINGRTVARPVKTGIQTNTEIEIRSGAGEKTQIVDPVSQ